MILKDYRMLSYNESEVLLEKYIKDGSAQYKQLSNQECYLIIGNQGLRAKPNVLAYLLGNAPNNPKQKQLIYPELHSAANKELYCECADFDYSGSIAKKLTQAMSLEIAANMVGKIKGFVVIFDYQDIHVGRGDRFKKLAHTLYQLSNDNLANLFQSTLFIMVNKPNVGTSSVIKDNVLNSLEREASELQQALSDAPEDEIEFNLPTIMEESFYSLLAKHRNQLYVLDENDQGEMRLNIQSTLQTLSPIDASKLNYKHLYKSILQEIDEREQDLFLSKMQEKITSIIMPSNVELNRVCIELENRCHKLEQIISSQSKKIENQEKQIQLLINTLNREQHREDKKTFVSRRHSTIF